MRELGTWEFDAYAMSLPRGHGFGDTPPIGAYLSDDKLSWATLCQNDSGAITYFIMRRRVDRVWTRVTTGGPFSSRERAIAAVTVDLERPGVVAEPLPPEVPRRPALYDLKGREPSELLKLIARPSHRPAAWMLEQLYLALPKPDPNWASDLQSANFHTRLWEAQLLASFREQGIFVEQPYVSPDFRLQNRLGGVAWVEAVTANPPTAYEHVNAPLSDPPTDKRELFFGAAAVRYAKTIGSKLQRGYADMDHVRGQPFAIAIADFHASGSMTWSRQSLIGYLYGVGAQAIEVDGQMTAVPITADRLLGASNFRAGLFASPDATSLAAIIFSNACSIAKFNRVAVSGAGAPDGYRYIRTGAFADWTPGAVEGLPFSLDVTSDEYRSLWPHGYEPWCAELEVFHNPFAAHPLPFEIMPEAMHWYQEDGEIISSTIYPKSILWSHTNVLHENSDKTEKLKT